MEDPTLFLFIGGSLVLQQTLPEFSGVKLLRWVLMDPDDVIRKLLAFGALFRTQATLFTLKGTYWVLLVSITTVVSVKIPNVQ